MGLEVRKEDDAIAKSLTNLRAHTRTYLDEATQDDWTDTEVDVAINNKYLEVYTAVVEVYEDYNITRANLSTVADQQEYTLASDFFKMRRVEINYNTDISGSVAIRARHVRMDDVFRNLGNTTIGLGIYRNAAYYIRSSTTASTIGFIPIPTKAGTNAITYWYVPLLTELSAVADTITIPFPDRYGQLIALGAAAQLLRKGQQEEVAAAKYLLDFEMGVKKMQQELENRLAEDANYVVDTAGEDTDFATSSLA